MRQLLPLALLPLTLTACDLPATRIVEMPATYFSKLSGIDDATGLHIDNGTGSVHLIQGGPEIEGTLVLYGEHTEVQVHIVDGVVVFDAECSDLVCAVDFDLRVPEGWSVTVDNPTGSVRVESLAPSWLVVDTGSGTIDVTDVTADAVDLDSGSGAITLADVSSNALALDTGSGGLNGSAIRTEDLRAETGAGAVSLEVPHNRGTCYCGNDRPRAARFSPRVPRATNRGS